MQGALPEGLSGPAGSCCCLARKHLPSKLASLLHPTCRSAHVFLLNLEEVHIFEMSIGGGGGVHLSTVHGHLLQVKRFQLKLKIGEFLDGEM